MNDFTKEEREEIVDMMHHARKQGVETTHNLSYQVELKAKCFIENYCEHQFILKGKGAQVFTQCEKCGYRLFKDE